MYIDSQEQFSVNQVVTAIGDTVSTNILDTLAAQDEGIGESMWFTAICTAQVTSAGAPTVQAVLQTAIDAPFTTPIDAVIGGSFLKAALVPNFTMLQVRLPVGLKRYLRAVWRVGTAVLTAGTFTAFLSKDIQAQQYGASGFSVV